MSFISDNIANNIKPSPTLMAEAKAGELKAQGHPVISLCTGELDSDTPEHIKLAAIEAIKQGYLRYTPSGGLKELKEAIVNKFKRENNLEYNINEVCACSGAKQVIYNAFVASLNPGEEVIIPTPFWGSYLEIIKIAGGLPVVVKDNDFNLDVQAIEKAITNKTKWLMLNSPNNPSGKVYSYEQLRELADMLLKHEHVHVLSDDIYEHIVYDQAKFYNLVQIEPKLKDRVLLVNGVSKTYAMTGWRLGYAAGPVELIKAMTTVQSQSTSSPCSISQKAAIAALNGPQDFIKDIVKSLIKRSNLAHNLINKIPGLSCLLPSGAFFIMINCSGLFGKKTPKGIILNNSNDVAVYFLEQAYLAVVDGSPFGVGDGYLRISYAVSEANLEEACNRMKQICEMLSS